MRIAFLASFLVCFAISALAADNEDAICVVNFSSTDAGFTNASTDGGCTWLEGATIIMQCDQDVYFNQGNPQRAASSQDFIVKFTINPDPYKIFLGNKNKVISVIGSTAAGSCKFSDSPRRKPW